AWVASDGGDAALQARYPGHDVAIAPGLVADLQRRQRGVVRMFMAEGGFFCLLTAVGAWLILRVLNYETSLMLRQANFLSAVTHELKSPLTSLRLYTDTLSMRELPKAKRDEYLRNMRTDLLRLGDLVGNLLAAARLDDGRTLGTEEVVDLNLVVPQCAAPLQQRFAEHGVALQVDTAAAPLWVRCDPSSLCTVVRNLLDNARKYGASKPVSLTLCREQGQAVMRVQDLGIGLAAAEQDNIFHKFYRVGDEMVRQTEGSGLGLYLARALLQQSGGVIDVSSAGAGTGSRFTVRLPLHDGRGSA
ncbi:MAG: HAMP domain-containing histidine kinase, partial [Deltaproteobacteria bacterium]